MKLEDASRTDYVCVFVSHHLAWMAAPLMHQSLWGLGCGPRTSRSVLFKQILTHTWVYLPKSSHQWLPDTAAWWIMMKKKQPQNRCYSDSKLMRDTGQMCGLVHIQRVRCHVKEEILREQTGGHGASKTNRSTSMIVDISWRAYSNNLHTPPDFAMEMKCICVWGHLWLGVILR